MRKRFLIALLAVLFSGCSGSVRMQTPEDPQGRYREQIAVARRLLEQKEAWANRAEWEVQESGDGWKVIAWRVEHPECKGPSRYVPWGYSEIDVDRLMLAVRYRRRG